MNTEPYKKEAREKFGIEFLSDATTKDINNLEHIADFLDTIVDNLAPRIAAESRAQALEGISEYLESRHETLIEWERDPQTVDSLKPEIEARRLEIAHALRSLQQSEEIKDQ